MREPSGQINPAEGAAFDDADVAACYAHRPPYPAALYHALLAKLSARRRALDLGCGPGKIARAIADNFEVVDAVDPSSAMIEAGRSAEGGDHAAIRWICAPAEEAKFQGPYDLIVSGAALHWMHHAVVFPKMAASLAPGGLLAAIDGDGPHAPPWEAEMSDFLRRWLRRFGARYDQPGFAAALSAHEAWMEIEGRESFDQEIVQDVGAFIACQHSRGTWTRAKMGSGPASHFDEDLRNLLAPHAKEGLLQFQVRSRLVWGRPKPVGPATA